MGLEKLSPQHYRAIRMRIAGHSNAEIIADLGIRERTLWLWWSDPMVKAEIDQQIDGINRIFMERMAGIGLAAMEALREMIAEEHNRRLSPGQRLDAVREAMDRIPSLQKPTPTQGNGDAHSGPPGLPGGQVNIFANMPNDQLMANAKALASSVVGLPPASDDGEGEERSTP
jgi:hypothetical protein